MIAATRLSSPGEPRPCSRHVASCPAHDVPRLRDDGVRRALTALGAPPTPVARWRLRSCSEQQRQEGDRAKRVKDSDARAELAAVEPDPEDDGPDDTFSATFSVNGPNANASVEVMVVDAAAIEIVAVALDTLHGALVAWSDLTRRRKEQLRAIVAEGWESAAQEVSPRRLDIPSCRAQV